MNVIRMEKIKRYYTMGDITVKALRGVNISIDKGEFVAIMGPSGSGKSTLMNILGCLDKPTSGTYVIDGLDVGDAEMDDFADIRNEKIGFVFQGFNLLSRTSALENVELPLFYNRNKEIKDPRARAVNSLKIVGLGDRLEHVPGQLSGGQQQRVAIARALVNEPVFILADEPTGNLDTETTLGIMVLFQQLNKRGITIIMVTHEPEVARYVTRRITMRDGSIISDESVGNSGNAEIDLKAWRSQHDSIYPEREGVSI